MLGVFGNSHDGKLSAEARVSADLFSLCGRFDRSSIDCASLQEFADELVGLIYKAGIMVEANGKVCYNHIKSKTQREATVWAKHPIRTMSGRSGVFRGDFAADVRNDGIGTDRGYASAGSFFEGEG